ncbi:MAG TPA: 4-oxalocrotonate tautomerase [Candidatus Coatesbacteria bacterium]|nr:4-oxalocrotonate tautomerase [Candidatus Coatesbacteria bacterium]
MPNITVEGPALELEKKRLLVKALYDAARAVYGIEDIVVLIHENPPENVGVGGRLIADRHKEAGEFKKKF